MVADSLARTTGLRKSLPATSVPIFSVSVAAAAAMHAGIGASWLPKWSSTWSEA